MLVDRYNTIVFRVDSSTQIGSGHLRRCLTLAERLRDNGQTDIRFISRDLVGNLNHLIKDNGYFLYELSGCTTNELLIGYEKWMTVSQLFDAGQVNDILQSMGLINCLIVDSYAIGECWERKVRPYVKKIMVIDDLANRKHDCDILFDQNYEADLYQKYDDLVPFGCKKFLGMKFLLLRDEFYQFNKKIIRTKVKRILCFFGGSDVTNQTERFLQAISFANCLGVKIDIVVGESNKNKDKLKRKCEALYNVKFHYQINYMARLMAEADLYIGSCGIAIWECGFLGVPSIIMSTTESELTYMKNLKTEPPFFYIGWYSDISIKFLLNYIDDFIKNYDEKRDKIKTAIIADRHEIKKMISFIKNFGV